MGTSLTGSTGIRVDATLNGVHSVTTYTQSFTAIDIILYGGNDNVFVAPTLTIPTTVSAGNGNDNLLLGAGNNSVTLGNGNDNVLAGNGNNIVTLGNGNDITLVGNGNNILVEGKGNDNILAGSGDNLIVAGLGRHNVLVGNGNNILIDGSVDLPIATLSQILNDWIDYGKTKSTADYNYIQQTLSASVTYNTEYANTLLAGNGLDWFWATDPHDL